MEVKTEYIPALRFSEFENIYQKKLITEVTTWKSGGTPSKENNSYWSGSIPWISASSMKGIEYKEADHYISEEGLRNGSKLAFPNTLLLLVRGSMLFNKIPVGIATRDLAFNQDVKNIEPSQELVPRYLLQWFLSKEHLLLGMVLGTGIGAGKLETDEVKNLPIFIPSLPEQQKIATFLSAVDEKIQHLTRKKSLLERYKKAVMQKIFNRELRFKDNDGREFPDWDEKTLGEVTFKVDQKNKNKENLPVFSINNIKGFVSQNEQFDGVDSYQRGFDTSMYKIIEDNTFAYNPARINVGSIGYSGKIGRVIVSSLYVCFKTNPTLHDGFLLQFMKTSDFQKSVLRSAEGGVREYLFYENFSRIAIALPSIPEQMKIYEFLFSIDERINQAEYQLQYSQQWKKGLLQQMFV